MPTLAEVVESVHQWYPPHTAEPWDAVGLVSGDPAAEVGRVMLSVDPTLEVAEDAAAWGADLLVTHHPLFLRGVHGIARDTAKGRTLGVLLDAGCGLLTAHTNADRALDGVAHALADALGLTDQRPLVPDAGPALDKLTTYVPEAHADVVRVALAEVGAGAIGDYDGCSFSTPGEGRFRPLHGAQPAMGTVGTPEVVAETRIECVLPASLRREVVAAMLAAHPYEEPAYDVVALRDTTDPTTGLGRVGSLPGLTLRAFAERVAGVVPGTVPGVRVSGDPDRVLRTVAVLPGSGDDLFDAVLAAGAEAYVTSDLRHHPVGEFVEKQGTAVVDVPHWAAEWPWLPVVERKVREEWGDRVETRVSTRVTDAWTFRI